MNIGVNSRLIQNAETGIQRYIKSVYDVLQKDERNSYTFFQTHDEKKIGATRIVPLGLSNWAALLFDLLLVNVLVFQSKVKLFHAPSHVLPLFKIPGVMYVVSIMDLSFLTVPSLSGGLFNAYYEFVVGRSLKLADAIIAISESTKRDIVAYYNIDPKKITVTHLGVDGSLFASKKHTRIFSKPYFFSVTTHPKRKNIHGILDAMMKSKQTQDLTFVLAGLLSADSKKDLEAEIARRGLENRVFIKGYVSQQELISLYQHAEFFIYPSFYEGFGLPPVEAMACGCPCIVSSTSSLPEVQPDSTWHIDPYSPEDIARVMDAMTTLTSKERMRLAEVQHAYAKRFTWDATAQQTIKLFQSVVKQ